MYLVEVGACDLQSGLASLHLYHLLLYCFEDGSYYYVWLRPVFLAPSLARSGFPASALSVCRRNLISPLSPPHPYKLTYFAADAQKRSAAPRRSIFVLLSSSSERGLSRRPFPRNANALCERAEISEIALSVATCKRLRRCSLFFLLFFLLGVLHFSCVFCMQMERL